MHTLKLLMRLESLNFHYLRLEQIYMQAFLTDPVMTTTLVMNRIQKLYEATEQLAVCFKLIYKLRS